MSNTDNLAAQIVANWILRFTKLGMVLAMIISWSVNQSIAWAIVHGIFGWFYVVYYLGTR